MIPCDNKLAMIWLVSILFLVVGVDNGSTSATTQGKIIEQWADEFGKELWTLGQSITKAPDINSRYWRLNAKVEPKNTTKLLASVVNSVNRMLSRKMDAIKCILKVVEEAAEEFDEVVEMETNISYYSSKLPMFLSKKEKNSTTYLPLTLNPDTHFYNIPVNTEYSSVHVPTTIYEEAPIIKETIMWTDSLDSVFVQNYNSDPALSWQYFGSATGVLRHYPAMAWTNKDDNLFDCRTRSWYIEAATCSKDIVILYDNSGSMTGMRNTIARVTISEILNTLSNNDYVNIFLFTNVTKELIPCFKDTLVQATYDNLQAFREAMKEVQAKKSLKPDGYANFPIAFGKAFDLLEKYRIKRGCVENNTDCNQAIMLVTDGVPDNLTEVFLQHNRPELDNTTRIPVRVFTYLVGKEVTKVREIQWMACLNRGYYVHIEALAEVTTQVLKYINVIAQPLVLQGVVHPITWTHAYIDTSYKQTSKGPEDYRLLTSVAIPAFDTKVNKQNDSRTADLLGIAGTDVPIDDIKKLTLPHRLGANAYAFIVSNNGYVLMHPDLRPTFKGFMNENYNSVDLSEIEQIDDDSVPWQPGQTILKLRQKLVDHVNGSMLDVPVKFHYDKMRRVSHEKVDFHFAPLVNTPFSIGIALPQGYGNNWIRVGDELKKNLVNSKNITEFFKGNNWKVHPDWVYCKYHYLEGHEFETPEDELIHFLKKMSDQSTWKWSQQYESDTPISWVENEYDLNVDCGRKSLEDDDYYCNQELVQGLVFDAKVTDSFNNWNFRDNRELFKLYNATLRFVATMTGLTRWQYISPEDEDDTKSEFGDYHSKAVDESWYKSAVLQHEIDPESYVFTVPHLEDLADIDDEDIVVTASHAVFPKDGGREAPGSVVGFQFQHSEMYTRFMQITSKVNVSSICTEGLSNCLLPCEAEELDCYVIDNSGYVILSETFNDTGKFFGEIETAGAIMKKLINLDIFKKITVYDYQGLCIQEIDPGNAAMNLLNPLHHISWVVDWIITKILWIAWETELYYLWDSNWVYAHPQMNSEELEDDDEEEDDSSFEEEEIDISKEIPKEKIYLTTRCDYKVDLYVLQKKFVKESGYHAEPACGLNVENCSRPFFVKRIPHTNLLLIVVKSMEQTSYEFLSASPTLINNTEPFYACQKLPMNNLSRRRLSGCFTEHPLEHEIEKCGGAYSIKYSMIYLTVQVLFVVSTARMCLY